MTVQTWVNLLVVSLQSLWLKVAAFLPSLVGAVIVFVVGLVIAAVIGRLIEELVHNLRLDALLKKLGLETYLHRANVEVNSGYFFGRLVYWFILLAFVLAASDILNFTSLSSFIIDVLLYLPRVIIAGLIMIAALLAANFVRGLAAVSVLGGRVHGGKFLRSLAWWVVFIFGALVALSQLGVATQLIETVVTGVITMFALAGGLAFGLGGRDVAAKIWDKMYASWEHDH